MNMRQYLCFLMLPVTLAASQIHAADEPKEYRNEGYGVGDYIDDASITSKVKLALVKEASLNAANINVETTNGVVELSGTVASEADEMKAVEVARNVRGVQAVREEIEAQ